MRALIVLLELFALFALLLLLIFVVFPVSFMARAAWERRKEKHRA